MRRAVKNMSLRYWGCLVLMGVLLSACQEKTRFYIAGVENEIDPVQIERFDQDFFEKDSASLWSQYETFLPLYYTEILRLPPVIIEALKSDTSVARLRAEVNAVYDQTGQVEEVEKKLTRAWAYYHHYFPNRRVPRTLFHISGFNQSIVTTPDLVSASVESYLGADHPAYPHVAYQYEIPFMTPRHLPIDILRGWLLSEFPDESSSLLDALLFQGKIYYLLQVFFPDETPAEILAYSDRQFQWCQQFEEKIWTNLLENREIFSTDWRVIMRYTSPAPFTTGYSQEESPGRLGAYIGWRLVQSYMEHNTHASISDLMNVTDALQFLQNSGYRP